MSMPPPDQLTPIVGHVNARARAFFTGAPCTRASLPAESGIGCLYLLRAGVAHLRDESGHTATMREPTLLFYARPLRHWVQPDPQAGADLLCATVAFAQRAADPLLLALPPRLEHALSELDGVPALLQLLFSEAFSARPGRQEVLDRLMQLVLIELLRLTLAREESRGGLLRGCAHPLLRRTLNALQHDPAHPWTLRTMAAAAHMSRSHFATVFRREVGDTPGGYLTRLRIGAAQALIRNAVPLKVIAARVGYHSQAGLLRAFKQVTGVTPTQWLRHYSPDVPAERRDSGAAISRQSRTPS